MKVKVKLIVISLLKTYASIQYVTLQEASNFSVYLNYWSSVMLNSVFVPISSFPRKTRCRTSRSRRPTSSVYRRPSVRRISYPRGCWTRTTTSTGRPPRKRATLALGSTARRNPSRSPTGLVRDCMYLYGHYRKEIALSTSTCNFMYHKHIIYDIWR